MGLRHFSILTVALNYRTPFLSSLTLHWDISYTQWHAGSLSTFLPTTSLETAYHIFSICYFCFTFSSEFYLDVFNYVQRLLPRRRAFVTLNTKRESFCSGTSNISSKDQMGQVPVTVPLKLITIEQTAIWSVKHLLTECNCTTKKHKCHLKDLKKNVMIQFHRAQQHIMN